MSSMRRRSQGQQADQRTEPVHEPGVVAVQARQRQDRRAQHGRDRPHERLFVEEATEVAMDQTIESGLSVVAVRVAQVAVDVP